MLQHGIGGDERGLSFAQLQRLRTVGADGDPGEEQGDQHCAGGGGLQHPAILRVLGLRVGEALGLVLAELADQCAQALHGAEVEVGIDEGGGRLCLAGLEQRQSLLQLGDFLADILVHLGQAARIRPFGEHGVQLGELLREVRQRQIIRDHGGVIMGDDIAAKAGFRLADGGEHVGQPVLGQQPCLDIAVGRPFACGEQDGHDHHQRQEQEARHQQRGG